jgi:hypothetical protein
MGKMATLLVPEVLIVQNADAMDTDTFIRHLNHRHDDSISGGELARPQFDSVEEAWRAFHERLHSLRDLEHEHDA